MPATQAGKITSAPAPSLISWFSRVGAAPKAKWRSHWQVTIHHSTPITITSGHSPLLRSVHRPKKITAEATSKLARKPSLVTPASRVHSQIATRKAIATRGAKISVDGHRTSSNARGKSSRAVSTRWSSMGSSSALGDLVAGPAKAAFAAGVVIDRALQTDLIEVRPQGFGEIQLGIGQLPQQEIADAELAAGTDEQIQRRQVRQGHPMAEQGFVDIVRADFTACDRFAGLACSLHDVPATAVIDRYVQLQPRVGCRARHRCI